MKTLLRVFYALLFLAGIVGRAQVQPYQNACAIGGQRAMVAGFPSMNYVQASYPKCTVTVYLTGTKTIASIYKDANSTIIANPFTANADGSFLFYAAVTQMYDVTISGGTPVPMPTAFTFTSVSVGGGGGGGSNPNALLKTGDSMTGTLGLLATNQSGQNIQTQSNCSNVDGTQVCNKQIASYGNAVSGMSQVGQQNYLIMSGHGHVPIWPAPKNYDLYNVVFADSINQAIGLQQWSYKRGDAKGFYCTHHFTGGAMLSDDEGIGCFSDQTLQEAFQYHGTVTTGGTGSTTPVFSFLSGDNNFSGGTYVLNETQAVKQCTFSSSVAIPGTYLQGLPLAGCTIPKSTSWGVSQTSLPQDGGSVTVSISLGFTGGAASPGPFVAGSTMWKAGQGITEQVKVMSVAAPVAGVQAVTISGNQYPSSPGDFYFQNAGTALDSRAFVFTADTQVSMVTIGGTLSPGIQSAYPLIGSVDGITAIYCDDYAGGCAPGGVSHIVPLPGAQAAIPAPCPSGSALTNCNQLTIYEAAQIESITANTLPDGTWNGSSTLTSLRPNDVAWTPGDFVVNAFHPTIKMDAHFQTCYPFIKSASATGGGCYTMLYGDSGINQYVPVFRLKNINNSAWYAARNLMPSPIVQHDGAYSSLFAPEEPPYGGAIIDLSKNWTSGYGGSVPLIRGNNDTSGDGKDFFSYNGSGGYVFGGDLFTTRFFAGSGALNFDAGANLFSTSLPFTPTISHAGSVGTPGAIWNAGWFDALAFYQLFVGYGGARTLVIDGSGNAALNSVASAGAITQGGTAVCLQSGTNCPAASSFTYPPAGVPQSTGSAWGSSLATATTSNGSGASGKIPLLGTAGFLDPSLVHGPFITDTFATTMSVSGSTGLSQGITLTANTTITVTLAIGQTLALTLFQDDAAGHIPTFVSPGGIPVRWQGNTNPYTSYIPPSDSIDIVIISSPDGVHYLAQAALGF